MVTEHDYLAYVDHSPVADMAKKMRHSALAGVSQVFAANIRAAHDLALLPQYLVTRVGVEIDLTEPDRDPGPAQRRAVSQMQRFASDVNVAASLRAVRRAVVTEVWTAFEVLSNDAREVMRPNRATGGRGLGAIIRSYQSAFGDQAADLLGVFDSHDLRELAELRHLLVHRAGRVDELFVSKVSGDESPGDSVRLNGSRVMRLGAAAVSAGIALLSKLERRNASALGRDGQ